MRPLGYEHYDARLQRLGRSVLDAVTSADEPHVFVSELIRLTHLNLSRRLSCTNPCTDRSAWPGDPG
jgi:hypothetical protein